jgi:hypothetical protein
MIYISTFYFIYKKKKKKQTIKTLNHEISYYNIFIVQTADNIGYKKI